MRLSTRAATVLGAIWIPVLSALWFADAAYAAVTQHEGHTSMSLPSPESLARLAHGAPQGTTAFLAGLVVFAAFVWLPASRTEDVEGEKAVGLFYRWTWVLVGLVVVAGLVELPVYAVRASGRALSPGLLAEALYALYDTRTGHICIARVVLALLVAAAATCAAWRRNPAYWWGPSLSRPFY